MKWGGAEEKSGVAPERKRNGEVPKRNLRISLNIAAGGTGFLRHSSRIEHKFGRNSVLCELKANRGTPVDMRTIDIFVSSPADVQKESAVAEQLIRSVAAEFNLPIKVSYSNPLRESKEEDEISVEREDFGDGSTLVLGPCFWEYPDLEEDDFLEQIPNTGQYDLVICILWSRLGPALVQKCVTPDGSRPRSGTEYEVAWVLDQSKLTPGFPGLHVYRNRTTPAAPLEPKEKRENL